jgi:hypothetical protein
MRYPELNARNKRLGSIVIDFGALCRIIKHKVEQIDDVFVEIPTPKAKLPRIEASYIFLFD